MKRGCEIFFELYATHSYYQSGVCECLGFKPDEETMLLFKRYKIGISGGKAGFRLYTCGNSISALVDSLASSSDRAYFQIDITCLDVNFYNFTDLPANWVGNIGYNTGNASMEENGTMTLNPTLGDSSDFAHAGQICINFTDMASASKNPQYQIGFIPRATQWQYYIINRSKLQLASPQIEGDASVKFDGPETITTATGEPAVYFSSGRQVLPLCNWSRYKFNLVDRLLVGKQDGASARSTAKMIFKGLPNPNPDFLSPVMIDGLQQQSSPMYIYL
jgi:hypothetical protein